MELGPKCVIVVFDWIIDCLLGPKLGKRLLQPKRYTLHRTLKVLKKGKTSLAEYRAEFKEGVRESRELCNNGEFLHDVSCPQFNIAHGFAELNHVYYDPDGFVYKVVLTRVNSEGRVMTEKYTLFVSFLTFFNFFAMLTDIPQSSSNPIACRIHTCGVPNTVARIGVWYCTKKSVTRCCSPAPFNVSERSSRRRRVSIGIGDWKRIQRLTQTTLYTRLLSSAGPSAWSHGDISDPSLGRMRSPLAVLKPVPRKTTNTIQTARLRTKTTALMTVLPRVHTLLLLILNREMTGRHVWQTDPQGSGKHFCSTAHYMFQAGVSNRSTSPFPRHISFHSVFSHSSMANISTL